MDPSKDKWNIARSHTYVPFSALFLLLEKSQNREKLLHFSESIICSPFGNNDYSFFSHLDTFDFDFVKDGDSRKLAAIIIRYRDPVCEKQERLENQRLCNKHPLVDK